MRRLQMETVLRGRRLPEELLDELHGCRSRYLRAGALTFRRSIERLADGRFYAWIEKGGTVTELRAFHLRKKAKIWRNQLYKERLAAIQNVRDAAKRRVKPPPTKVEILDDKIKMTRARLRESDIRIKRLQTYRTKSLRRLRGLEGALGRLGKTGGHT